LQSDAATAKSQARSRRSQDDGGSGRIAAVIPLVHRRQTPL